MYMEIEQTNHQDVAEPGQITSGVTGTGQKNETETGIKEHQTGENNGEFSSLTGFDRILQGPEDPDGFSCSMAFGQTAGTAQNPAAFMREISTASLKKSRKNKLVIGMGVLYNGEIKPVVNKNHTTAPAFQDVEEKSEDVGEMSEDVEEKLEDLIISLYEQQDRMVERATKKIDRLNSRLTALEEQRRSV
jgi:polyhydroxyalkanoate synthesis regulator phasin